MQSLRWTFTQSQKELSVPSFDLNRLQKMCNIANIFETNLKKIDAKNTIFFSCLRNTMLRPCKSFGKIDFL